MKSFEPAYIQTHRTSLLRTKAQEAAALLNCCTVCPRQCRVDRTAGETGYCQNGRRAVVASYNAHFGEEAPLVGQNGSGTIFFSHCNLLCSFCQNFDISHQGEGYEVSDGQLADIMLSLQQAGCHNINFVTPSHVVPQILAALVIAVENGLHIPLVYNSSAYDTIETLRILEGVIDIYMPDFKFWFTSIAERTCHAPDYPEVARFALLEMHRQVGDLRIDEAGLAKTGLLVRHLVLPRGIAGTREVMHFIAKKISVRTYVNIMSQYRPCGLAMEDEELSKSVSPQEYQDALEMARQEGITRLDQPRRAFILYQ